MAQTKQVVLVTTITATGAIVKNRFVNFKGAQAKVGEAILGVAPYDVETGDTAAVDVVGIWLGGLAGVFKKCMPCRLMSLKTGKKKQPAKSRRATEESGVFKKSVCL